MTLDWHYVGPCHATQLTQLWKSDKGTSDSSEIAFRWFNMFNNRSQNWPQNRQRRRTGLNQVGLGIRLKIWTGRHHQAPVPNTQHNMGKGVVAYRHGNGGCGIQAPDNSEAGYLHKHIRTCACEPISGTQTETSGIANPELWFRQCLTSMSHRTCIHYIQLYKSMLLCLLQASDRYLPNSCFYFQVPA